MQAPRGAPPSTYAILAAVEGEPGAWGRVAVATLVRSGLILPGLWFTGTRGWRAVAGAVAGSVGISAVLFVYYMLIRAQQARAAPAVTSTTETPVAEASASSASGDTTLN